MRPPLRRSLLLLVAATSVAIAVVGVSAVASTPPDTTQPGAEVASLVPGLLTADVLGVPEDWLIRDLDAELAAVDTVPVDLSDPFLGSFDCEPVGVPSDEDSTWLSRRYSAPEVPLENGLLAVDITIVPESESDAASRSEALDECEEPEFAQLTIGDGELTGAVAPADARTMELLAPPSADLPYAAAFNATIAHLDGTTVIVVFGGIDMGESWQDLADETATTVLELLAAPDGTGPPTTSSHPSEPSAPTAVTSIPA